jgi:hypothetical protein
MIPEEKARQIVEEWEKEAEKLQIDYPEDDSSMDNDIDEEYTRQAKDILINLIAQALHRAPPSEPMPDEIEKAARFYGEDDFIGSQEDCFKAGAKWAIAALKRNGGE